MSEINPEIMAKIDEITSWSNKRASAYNHFGHQLNMIYDDIKSGKFGEEAKTSSWYLWVKSVKEANPKPENIEELEKELEALLKE